MAPLSELAGDALLPPTPPLQWDNLSAATHSQDREEELGSQPVTVGQREGVPEPRHLGKCSSCSMWQIKLHGPPEEDSASLCSHQGMVSNPENTLKPSDEKPSYGPVSLPLGCPTSFPWTRLFQNPQNTSHRQLFPDSTIRTTLSPPDAPTAHGPPS